MAAFSRGFGIGSTIGLGLSQRLVVLASTPVAHSCVDRSTSRLAVQAIRRSPIIQAARSLQTSSRLCLQKQTASSTARTTTRTTTPKASTNSSTSPTNSSTSPTKIPRPSNTPSPSSSTPKSISTSSISQRLAAREKPTVLYQGPSHFWLFFSSFFAATFCIGYAFIHYLSIVAYPPEGLAWWIPHGFAVICLFMALFGIWFLYSSAFIVRRITAVPTGLLPAAQLRSAAAQAKGKPKGATRAERETAAAAAAAQLQAECPVMLESEVSSLLPFLQPRKIVARPSEVLLPFKFSSLPMAKEAGGVVAPPPADGVIGRIARPFEALGRGTSGAFSGLRRGLLREGFAPIKVNGMRYKIDVTGGKLFEQGRVLDHVVAFRPERFHDASIHEKILII